MRKNTKGKLMVALLSLAMVLTFIPMMAFADDDTPATEGNTPAVTQEAPVAAETPSAPGQVDPARASDHVARGPLISDEVIVTFDVNGHGVTPAEQRITRGTTATRPEDPYEEGWVFLGWYNGNVETTPFDFNTPITEDTVLNGVWMRVEDYIPEITYMIVSGADGTWLKDSGKDYEIVVKRSEHDELCFGNFYELRIDDVVLVRGVDYEAKQGSTILTIKAATLQKLSLGKHRVVIDFEDAEAVESRVETNITIKAASVTRTAKKVRTVRVVKGWAPRTGDANHVGMWFVVMVAAFVGAGILTAYERKRRDNR